MWIAKRKSYGPRYSNLQRGGTSYSPKAPHQLKRGTGKEYQNRTLPTNLFRVLWISILCDVDLLSDGTVRLLWAISSERKNEKFEKKADKTKIIHKRCQLWGFYTDMASDTWTS